MKHQFTPDNLNDLKKAVASLRTVQLSIETDGDAYERIDSIMRPIEELIDETENEDE